jgi:TolB protein
MNADGSGQINLTNSPGMDARPSWSRKGNFIVFTSTRDFAVNIPINQEIYIMEGDGGNKVRLTNNTVYDDFPYIK